MIEIVPLRFRPSLVICLGASGEAVCDHLLPLLEGLDAPLRRGVGVIHVAESTAAARSFVPTGKNSAWRDSDQRNTLYEAAFDTLGRLQGLATMQMLEDAGFSVPDKRTAVYIIGNIHASGLREAASTVLQAMRRRYQDVSPTQSDRAAASVQYVLLTSPDSERGDAFPPIPSGPISLGDYEVPAFCYVYDRVTRDDAYATPGEVTYGAAEAIFALIATGLTAAGEFSQALQISPYQKDYSGHIGSLSTSMVYFPRAHITDYCSAMLGHRVVTGWAPGTQGTAMQPELQRSQREADAAIGAIRGWMADSEERPASDGYLGPTLAVLQPRGRKDAAQPEHARIFQQWKEQSRRLFHRFDPVQAESRAAELAARPAYSSRNAVKRHNEAWRQAIRELRRKSDAQYSQWERASMQAWLAASELAQRQTRDRVVDLWLGKPAGAALAHEYVTTANERLIKLADQLVQWRTKHHSAFEDAFGDFEQMADERDWTVDDPLAPPSNGAARVRLNGSLGQSASLSGSKASALNGSAIAQEARDPLDELAGPVGESLQCRAEWMAHRVPTLPALAGGFVIAWAMLALVTLALLPIGLTTSVLPSILVVLATGLLDGGVLWLFWRQAGNKARQTWHDAVAFHELVMAYRCERREDDFRRLVLGPLRRSIQQMNDALDDVRAFFDDAGRKLESDAQEAHRQLFAGPSATRDVFIANGQRLQPESGNTLEALNVQLDQRRQIDHPTERIRAQILQRLRERHGNIFDIGFDEISQVVREEMRTIVSHYLQGSVAAIGEAIAQESAWETMLDRTGLVLYIQRGSQQTPLCAVAGRLPEQRRSEKLMPPEAVRVTTANPEWLIVASLHRGADPQVLPLDSIFAVRREKAAASLDFPRDNHVRQPVAVCESSPVSTDRWVFPNVNPSSL